MGLGLNAPGRSAFASGCPLSRRGLWDVCFLRRFLHRDPPRNAATTAGFEDPGATQGGGQEEVT
jgi:hypothetical protein